MARIRTVKPALFRHEELFEAESITGLPLRLSFIGLFTCCDREGRFNWRPRELKLDVLPYDETDFSRVLDALASRGFIVKYACSGQEYGFIPSFPRHQVINNRETPSNLPNPSEETIIDASSAREARVTDLHKGKGREGNMEGKGREDTCAAPSQALTLIDDPVLITFPTNKIGKTYAVTQSQFDAMVPLYPAVDVPQELRLMAGWLTGNPSKAKTHAGMPRFINAWLSKKQDRSGMNGQSPTSRNGNWLAGAASLASEIRSGDAERE